MLRKNLYYCLFLGYHDFIKKFKNLKFGILWSVLNYILFSLLISFFFSNSLNESFFEYFLYVFSGIITWSYFRDSLVNGGKYLILNSSLIFDLNTSVWLLCSRYLVSISITFLINLIILIIFKLFSGKEIYDYYKVIFFLPFLILLMYSLIIIVNYINLFFQDFENILSPILTALFFLTPVVWREDFLILNTVSIKNYLLDYNILYKIIKIFRFEASFFDICILILLSLFLFFLSFFFLKKINLHKNLFFLKK
jgi:ABC-type polysaccharide/polyol phosphate export permease